MVCDKKTIKRQGNLILNKPILNKPCNARLPFEVRNFKDKEVIVNSRGPDFYVVNAKHPITEDEFQEPNFDIEADYQNFGFKAVIDPRDLTYSYTTKYHGHMKDPTIVRQLWLNGRLFYETLSGRKIVARGYEIEYSPECKGFIRDEVEFQFVRHREADFGPDNPNPPLDGQDKHKWPLVGLPERKSYIATLNTLEDKSVFVPNPKYIPFDSTKPKPRFMKDSTYKKQLLVPGMW